MQTFAGMAGTALACHAAALALTLLLAAWLTPRRWWRRPNLGALAVLGGGTLAFGALFGMLSGTLFPKDRPAPGPVVAAATAPVPATQAAAGIAPVAFRTADALNLRDAPGVGAARLAVLPAGTRVQMTGARAGEWWQVRATLGGRQLSGWSNSLWLRRPGEGAPAAGNRGVR